jgi:hypothetical protein
MSFAKQFLEAKLRECDRVARKSKIVEEKAPIPVIHARHFNSELRESKVFCVHGKVYRLIANTIGVSGGIVCKKCP